MTPSEIECGIQSGFLTQCFSPAAAAGGVAMGRALVGPYRHTRLALVPAGGLRMSDFQEYLAVPEVAAVAGRFLCEEALIEAGASCTSRGAGLIPSRRRSSRPSRHPSCA